MDIGGTKVAAGVVTAQGEILRKTRVPMPTQGAAEEAFAAVRAAVDSLLPGEKGSRERYSIGASSPGPLDPRSGVIINPPNLPCWRDFPLAQRIAETWSLPAAVDNDANAAALAEALWGAGRGYSAVFYATLGTGIGTGIVFDGKVYHGRTGAAGEGGHCSIDFHGPRCACGKLGCIEALASGPNVARRARRRIAESRKASKILELAGGNEDAVTGETVAEAYRRGDAVAKAVLDETAEYLAMWLGNVIDLIEPDVVIFGGGMGDLMAEWFDFIRGKLPAWTVNSRSRETPLLGARYSQDAGIAGGAAICLDAGKRAG